MSQISSVSTRLDNSFLIIENLFIFKTVYYCISIAHLNNSKGRAIPLWFPSILHNQKNASGTSCRRFITRWMCCAQFIKHARLHFHHFWKTFSSLWIFQEPFFTPHRTATKRRWWRFYAIIHSNFYHLNYGHLIIYFHVFQRKNFLINTRF